VIERDWHELGEWRLDEGGACVACGTTIAGRFAGPPGRWGRRRVPVRLATPVRLTPKES
jgi:pyruvate formate lyase activating enzyme